MFNVFVDNLKNFKDEYYLVTPRTCTAHEYLREEVTHAPHAL